MSREYSDVTGSKILVIGGDAAKGQLREFEGVLRGVRPSTMHPQNSLYDFTDAEGEERTVAGCAAVNSRLKPKHIGRWVKLSFKGMQTSKGGKPFKEITVGVGPVAASVEIPLPDEPISAEDDGDDLPF